MAECKSGELGVGTATLCCRMTASVDLPESSLVPSLSQTYPWQGEFWELSFSLAKLTH